MFILLQQCAPHKDKHSFSKVTNKVSVWPALACLGLEEPPQFTRLHSRAAIKSCNLDSIEGHFCLSACTAGANELSRMAKSCVSGVDTAFRYTDINLLLGFCGELKALSFIT